MATAIHTWTLKYGAVDIYLFVIYTWMFVVFGIWIASKRLQSSAGCVFIIADYALF